MSNPFRFAIVDVETTGLHITQDTITEIAVIIITEEGIETSWQRLINPCRPIPTAVSELTGIRNEMVVSAPVFSEIAIELMDMLHDCILVAHNARFDFAFLKNAFKKSGFDYLTPMLCTIKLFKKLYPHENQYDLKSLLNSFDIERQTAHRAMSDAQALHQLLLKSIHDFSLDTVLKISKTIYSKSSLPSKLVTDIHSFPETPGVYLFYGSNSIIPLYIGKSVSLRQRVLSHFQADYSHAKEFAMAQQVERIEIIPTAGELGALLLESELIKEKMPIYNRKLRRKKSMAGFSLKDDNGYLSVSVVHQQVEEEEDLKTHGLIGAFRNQSSAKRILLSLIKKHELCPKLCRLEQTKGACFSHQLKRCEGACVGKEEPQPYNARVLKAMEEYREKDWPFEGPIAIKEYCPELDLTQFLIFNDWRYCGSMDHEQELEDWKDLPKKRASNYLDAYKILKYFLKEKPVDIMSLYST